MPNFPACRQVLVLRLTQQPAVSILRLQLSEWSWCAQTHIPTEAHPKKAHPRLSRSHEFAGWTQGPPGKAAARSQASVYLDVRAQPGDPPMRRPKRLTHRRDIRRVLRRGRTFRGTNVSVRMFQSHEPSSRFAFAVRRGGGGAVKRNLARRRLREAARSLDVLPRLGRACLSRVPGPASELRFDPRRFARDSLESRNPSWRRGMKAVALWLIRRYQQTVSPGLPSACRFEPTCSHYAYEAIETYGLIRGGFLATKRLARCHPFTSVRHDPVP